MKTTRRKFLQASAAASAAGILPTPASGAPNGDTLDAYQIAQRHLIVRDLPTPDFFEGMLLGNGDVGVCATVRPDALGLHLGKSDSWDIRVSEDHDKYVLTFNDLLKLWERASEEAKRRGDPDMLFLETRIDSFREYTERVASSYRKSWPRPWPCGILWIHWDSRWVRLVRQALDPSHGLLSIELEHRNPGGSCRDLMLSCFVDWETGLLTVSTDGPAPFPTVAYYPNLDDEDQLPPPEIDASVQPGAPNTFAQFSCYQLFPANAPTEQVPNPPRSDKDRNFVLYGRLAGNWAVEGLGESQDQLRRRGVGSKDTYTSYEGRPGVLFRNTREQPFRLDLMILTPRDHADNVHEVERRVAKLSGIPVAQIMKKSAKNWQQFWSRSAVEFEDKELEKIWYHNQYFLACCLREGKVAPGLFGNWTSGKIGTAWHGDYHMNYNTQQVFWGVFSSNHAEQHLPYVELCENLLPMSEAYAREKFGLPGAYFPHSAYPVPSQVVPYPAPPWGYQISETPWTIQSLWWHYLYTRDLDLLRRVYPLLRAAARFVVAYVKNGEDGKYHIIPTVSSENWGFTVDYRLNKDCILDLALTAFLLDAVVEASKTLQVDASERVRWAEVRANLAPYPRAAGPYGEVWVDVVDAPAEHVYNVPLTLAPVFPGEQVGIGLREEQLEIARHSAAGVRLEGGNDLVYLPLILARLGTLDLKWFKNEIRYCLLPGGWAGDRVRQVGGRYKDSTDFDFMMRMGVWTENLSLPAVLNECLMQSYSGTLRLFPNTHGLRGARFQNLRAVGAFLVSAAYDGNTISSVILLSEKGLAARLGNPWGDASVRVIRLKNGQPASVRREGDMLLFSTEPGESYRIERA